MLLQRSENVYQKVQFVCCRAAIFTTLLRKSLMKSGWPWIERRDIRKSIFHASSCAAFGCSAQEGQEQHVIEGVPVHRGLNGGGPAEQFHHLAETVTGGVIENCGHWVIEEQPGRVLEDLGEFVRQ